MSFALVRSRALRGLESPAVTVEVHLANGLPSFTLVGLADTEVKESRERVRAALQTSGLEFPHNKRVTVSLAPADLPNRGSKQSDEIGNRESKSARKAFRASGTECQAIPSNRSTQRMRRPMEWAASHTPVKGAKPRAEADLRSSP